MHRLLLVALTLCGFAVLSPAADIRPNPNRNVTFLSTSDCHYRTADNRQNNDWSREKGDFSFQANLKQRNEIRKQKGLISNGSENGLHYSWDWDDVHFVQLNLYPADKQNPKTRYSPEWHDPQNALAFRKLPDNKVARQWDGAWGWRWLLEKRIPSRQEGA